MPNPKPDVHLKVAIGSYPHTQALRHSAEISPGVRLQHVDVSPISDAFKPMCRELAFDVAEMSITGYLLACVYQKGLTALPVFPVRAFGSSHAALTCNVSAGVTEPRDLEGKSVGARAYTGAASFWARGVLAHEFGVDISTITWVSSDEEHVAEYQSDAPRNAIYQIGAELSQMLRDGELAGAIGLNASGANVRPLIPAARDAALDYYRRTGIYQINHTVVVKDSLLAEHSWLAGALYDAFQTAKLEWLQRSPDLAATRDLELAGGDPFPYGLSNNRESLQAVVQFALEQKILPRPYTVEELFPLALD